MSMSKITPGQANEYFNRGEKMRFVDSRPSEQWLNSNNRLPGAVRIPPDEETEQHIADVGRDRLVVTYSDDPDLEASERVAERLHRQGFKDVRPLEGGYSAWVNAGYPLQPRK